MSLLKTHGYVVGNIDSTVICELPKLTAHTEQMRTHIAEDCQIVIEAVNVKATTTEKLGFIGRKEGLAAFAVVLLEK